MKINSTMIILMVVAITISFFYYYNFTKLELSHQPNFHSHSNAATIYKAPKNRSLINENNLHSLLAEFDLSGDVKFLDAAKKYFSNDSDYMIEAALAARTPDSNALSALEAKQPNNALPNILRAGMYANLKKWKEMYKELEIAYGKSELNLNTIKRMESKLDLFIEQPTRANLNTMTLNGDLQFLRSIQSLNAALRYNHHSVGGANNAARYGVDLAERLIDINKDNLINASVSQTLEFDVLRDLDPEIKFDDTGKTVKERLIEIAASIKFSSKYQSIFKKLFDIHIEPQTRVQFFARARSDGQISALEWFDEVLTASK